jgi:arogenate/prephenate dehydratase
MVREAVDDTAGAAKAIAESQVKGVAAVASRRAAELYGLEVYDEGHPG